MQQQGYQQLSDDANEVLNNTLKSIDANAVKEEQVVVNMLLRLKDNYQQTYDEIGQTLDVRNQAVANNQEMTLTTMTKNTSGAVSTMAENTSTTIDEMGKSTQTTMDGVYASTTQGAKDQGETLEGVLEDVVGNNDIAYGAIQGLIESTGTVINTTTEDAIEDIHGPIDEILIGAGVTEETVKGHVEGIGTSIDDLLRTSETKLGTLGTEIAKKYEGIADSITKAINAAKINLGYGDENKKGTVANTEKTIKGNTEKQIEQKKAELKAAKAAEPTPAKTTPTTPAQPAKKEEPKKTGGSFVVKPAKTSYTYTGKAIKPGVTVTANGKTVASGSYTATYTNNVKVGTATIKVTGKGNYAGWTGSCTFSITAAKKKSSGGDGKARVGDKVTFASGVYHEDSYGNGNIGYQYRGKKVYITSINSGSPYPYHISTGKKLGSGDLGWLKLSQLKGYKIGTLGTKSDEFNWTHQGEIIRRSDGAILRQLPAGTQVLPQDLSENLMKWGAIDPSKLFTTSAPQNLTSNSSQVTTNYYDSLIHIDGNVDDSMLSRIDELANALLANRNFKQGSIKNITTELSREYRKTGH